MSVCAHDPYCPGHGPEHDEATRRRGIFEPAYVQPPVKGTKDRSLPGKKRRRARRDQVFRPAVEGGA